MIEFENKKDGYEDQEEEKIATNERKANRKQQNPMRDTRSQNRSEFTQIKFVDPRLARQELPLNQAKERRQKLFQENRSAKKENMKKEQSITEIKDSKHISMMIKELTQVLNNYMAITTQEIDNLKKIISTNHKITIEDNKKFDSLKTEIDSRMQNTIDAFKSISQKHEALESLVVDMTTAQMHQENPDNTKFKQNYSTKQGFLKAILHNKKRYDNGIMVLNDGSSFYIKKVWWKWTWRRGKWNTFYYVYDEGKLINFKSFYEKYEENMIFGEQSIKEKLKEIKQNRVKYGRIWNRSKKKKHQSKSNKDVKMEE